MFGSNSLSHSNASGGANIAAGDGSDMISQNLSPTFQGIAGRRATRSTGMFYAYSFNTARNTIDTNRMVITFASRAVADEWWRAVSTSDAPFLRNSIQRITPHLYSHDTDQFALNSFFNTPELKAISDNFRGKMFPVVDDAPAITIIPTEPIVDHVSGDWFSIRSTADPSCYWAQPRNGSMRITTSYESRAFFKVWAKDMQEGAIMIDDDDIIIVAQHHGFLTLRSMDESKDVPLVGVTTVEWEAATFKFKDFRSGRFEVRYDNGNMRYYLHSKVSQQGWELAT